MQRNPHCGVPTAFVAAGAGRVVLTTQIAGIASSSTFEASPSWFHHPCRY
jgi:hypothetical protein